QWAQRRGSWGAGGSGRGSALTSGALSPGSRHTASFTTTPSLRRARQSVVEAIPTAWARASMSFEFAGRFHRRKFSAVFTGWRCSLILGPQGFQRLADALRQVAARARAPRLLAGKALGLDALKRTNRRVAALLPLLVPDAASPSASRRAASCAP